MKKRKEKIEILNSPSFDSGSFFRSVNEKIKTASSEIESDKKIKKNRGRKKKSKNYFTQETEDAIIKYNNTDNEVERDKIYREYIKYPFDKIAENIINTFQFPYIEEVYDDLKNDVIGKFLIELKKYNPEKGKAFSYFSTIAKHYLIIANNDAYEKLKSTRSIDQSMDDDNIEYDIVDSSYDEETYNEDVTEFIQELVDYWDNNITTAFKKERDINIAFAIVELLKKSRGIEFFNKKALYVLIREMTGEDAKYITKVLKKMTESYNKIKNEYYTKGYIEDEPFFIYKKK